MNPLLNPNVAYVLLVLGFLVGLMALFSPGTGLLEITALFALVLAGYSLVNLPINFWALGLLVLGFFPFVASVRVKTERTRWILLVVALVLYIGGSAFLFRDENGLPAVNIWLVLTLSAMSIGLTWLLTRKTIEAMSARPTFDLDRLIGMQGRASTDLHPEGSIYADGEEWSGHSQVFIPAGTEVKIISRRGLTLEVEPVPPKTKPQSPSE
jgi:membrane-bound serine protease (ClpP class)